MHDGRFSTLEEVIEHYILGACVLYCEPFNEKYWRWIVTFSEDKQALIAFLRTLTDEEFLNNSKFSSPF